MADNSDDVRRRQFLKWASAIGLTAIAPNTVSAIADERPTGKPAALPPKPAHESQFGDVSLKHTLEYGRVRERMTAAVRNDRPEEKFARSLVEALEEGDRAEYDVFVKTVGRKSMVETERYGRTVEGWAPTESEVRRLSRFGDVAHASAFISTTVSLEGVHEDDLHELASLPFVVSVGYDAPAHPHDGHERHVVEEEILIYKEDLRSDEYLGFETIEGEYDIDERVRVGVIDSGYGEPTNWVDDYAEQYIDEDLADGFDANWDNGDEYDHGAWVTNTLAYMLQDGWEDFIVPLRRNDPAEVRAAIEYACAHDIEVLNMSLGDNRRSYCTSAYCEELKAYTEMGYIPVASTGNEASSDQVSPPASSRFCVGVGGIVDDECSDGDGEAYPTEYVIMAESHYGTYDVARGTNYGPIEYDHEECPYCAEEEGDVFEEFVPDVYASFGVKTDYEPTGEGRSLYPGGTSAATPQVTAAAVVMQSYGLYDFDQAKAIFRSMDHKEICPGEAAQAGTFLHMPDVMDALDDLPPQQPRAPPNLEPFWVGDDLAVVEWRPSTAWGDREIDYYHVYVVLGRGGVQDTYEVPGDETLVGLTDLYPGARYSISVYAVDTEGWYSPASRMTVETDGPD